MGTNEIWKPIDGYIGIYEISSFGNVKVVKSGKLRKSRERQNGYWQINLSLNGKKKTYSIHQLVARAFLPNPLGYKQINHKDFNPSNNNMDNLEWCDSKYNNNHKWCQK